MTPSTDTRVSAPLATWLRGLSPDAPRDGERQKALDAADLIDELYEALVSAFNLMGTTTDCLNSGEPSRHRYAEQRLQREMDHIRAALTKARAASS
jgi:hypothetical protein